MGIQHKEVLSTLTKNPTQTFDTPRVCVPEAKRNELLVNNAEVVTGEQANAVNAIAARRKCVSLGKPEAAYASTALCSELACPKRHSVLRLKRLARYLVYRPRVVCCVEVEGLAGELCV